MKRLFLILAFLLLGAEANAVTYWAHPSGSATPTCANIDGESDPASYGTINGIINTCAPTTGDTIKLKNTATFTETVSDPPSGVTFEGESSSTFSVWANSSGSRTVSFNNPRSNVTFRYIHWRNLNSGADACVLWSTSATGTGMVVEDFECEGPATDIAADTASGFKVYGPTGTIIRRGKVFNWRSADGDPGAHGFYWQTVDGTVERVEITNVNGYCIQYYKSGLAVTGNTFRYNWCHDRNYASQGGIYAGQGSTATNGTKIYNNILSNVGGTKAIQAGAGVAIYNNTIYAASGGTGITSGTSTCALTNNLIYLATPNSSSCTSTTNRTGTAAAAIAVMIDPANDNFSLIESSVAIDAGTVITGFSEGRYVGGGVDQGALEAPIRSSAVVEDASDTTYSITFSLPTQSTGGNGTAGIGLQTCTVGNFAVTVAGAGATESSCAISGTSRVDVTLGAAVTVDQELTDAMTRSTSPSLMDNIAIGDPNGTHGSNFHNAYVRTYGATAGTNSVDGGALPAFTQTRYRFHKLRGTEASPSLLNAAATENVSVTLPPGAAFRLRVKFRTDDNPDATTFKLRYSKDAGAYTDIPDTISTDNIGWYGATSDTDIPAAGAATTELLTSDEATNVACAVVRTSSDYPLLDFNNGETECEYVLKISTSAAAGPTYDFRVYKGDNTALDTYSVTPRLTVGSYQSFGF